jgi:hypothetical protein
VCAGWWGRWDQEAPRGAGRTGKERLVFSASAQLLSRSQLQECAPASSDPPASVSRVEYRCGQCSAMRRKLRSVALCSMQHRAPVLSGGQAGYTGIAGRVKSIGWRRRHCHLL